MEVKVNGNKQSELEEMTGIRKGPWTLEEDTILVNYIATHGEGRWNSVASSAGLRRTGKSCRLRWLNYLRPDVRRGNITLQEQLLILDLHSRWGNRWSKIAQHLPGRTDNEIKNYWRTRVIKQAKQLRCDVNSKQFQDAMRYVWMPRLLERIRTSSENHSTQPFTSPAGEDLDPSGVFHHYKGTEWANPNQTSSESSMELQVHSISSSDHSEQYSGMMGVENGSDLSLNNQVVYEQGNNNGTIGCGGGYSIESMWNEENMWFLDELEIKDSFLA